MGETSASKTAVIADDHALVRNGLRAVLEAAGARIVGEAADGLEAIALAKAHRPDLLTLDAAMPLARGMEAYGEIRRWAPDTKIAVVTGFTGAGALADWLAVGADGVFLKSDPPDEMQEGFGLLLSGGAVVSKAVLAALRTAPEERTLTKRELQILHLVAEGCDNQEIGDRLSISPKTVDNHRTRMMAKLGVRSVAQLLAYALKEGLLDQNRQL